MTIGHGNWVKLLDSGQFCYDLYRSSTIEKSPFGIVLGLQPNTSLEAARSKTEGKSPFAYKYA